MSLACEGCGRELPRARVSAEGVCAHCSARRHRIDHRELFVRDPGHTHNPAWKMGLLFLADWQAKSWDDGWWYPEEAEIPESLSLAKGAGPSLATTDWMYRALRADCDWLDQPAKPEPEPEPKPKPYVFEPPPDDEEEDLRRLFLNDLGFPKEDNDT